jgi:tetratricopeptide (TPR) repeat protein
MAAMQAFRTADLQVGGGHLYASVLSYLQTHIAPRLFGSDNAGTDVVFTAATALTEMAGWMAHDSGRDALAEQHFDRSLTLANAGNDTQLTAHIFSSKSHLANHGGRPNEAIRLARQGRESLRGRSTNPELQARLLAMEALGFAGLREATECTRLLVQAEKTLETSVSESPSQWVSGFDEGSLAGEAARCMRQLGDLAEARRQAERVVRLRPRNRARSRAFGQLILASVLIDLGRLDEACVVTQEVLDSTQSLGSFLIIRQLNDLKKSLTLSKTKGNTMVGEFTTHLQGVLEERSLLYHWLTRHDERDHREAL